MTTVAAVPSLAQLWSRAVGAHGAANPSPARRLPPGCSAILWKAESTDAHGGDPTINSTRPICRVDKRSASTNSTPHGGCAALIHPTSVRCPRHVPRNLAAIGDLSVYLFGALERDLAPCRTTLVEALGGGA